MGTRSVRVEVSLASPAPLRALMAAVLVVLVLLVAGCGAATTGTPTDPIEASAPAPTSTSPTAPSAAPSRETDVGENVSDAAREAAEQMARRYGITVDEALRRLSMQSAIGELGTRAAALALPEFAGMWIDQENGGVLRILTTDAIAIEPLVTEATSLGLDPQVMVVAHSLAQLEAIATAITDGTDPDVGDWGASARVDVPTNTVIVEVGADGIEERAGELAALGRDELVLQSTHVAMAG